MCGCERVFMVVGDGLLSQCIPALFPEYAPDISTHSQNVLAISLFLICKKKMKFLYLNICFVVNFEITHVTLFF